MATSWKAILISFARLPVLAQIKVSISVYQVGPRLTRARKGDISYAIPSIQPSCWIRSEDDTGKQLGGPHTPDFEKAVRTEEAHGLAMRVAKALAATAVDVLTRPELLAEVKREFDEMKLVDELPRGADHW